MMSRLLFTSLRKEQSGAAAAEMALVAPMLIILMFGSFELGKYFLDEHVVIKAVRDGARFASRQKFADMPCGAASTKETQIKNVVRTGSPTGTTPRLSYWTDPGTVSVTISCATTGTYVQAGLYTTMTQVPTVTVSATVPYSSLFGAIGFNALGLSVGARSHSAVMGV